MATELRLRRGTTDEHGNFIGAEAEATVDTDKNTIVVHDGQTQGGFPLSREDSTDVAVDSVATLRASSFPANLERLYLSGYYGQGTPGGGDLYRDSGDTTTADNGGTVFVDADNNRWKRPLDSGCVHLEWFGIDTSGSSEVESVIQSAIDATPNGGTLIYPNTQGTLLIDIPSGQTSPRPSGVFVNHPMKIKGAENLVTKVKDFSSAWLDYTGVVSAYSITSSDVVIDGLFVDANADNHYETDGSGNKWWETGPNLKRPPGGIQVYCPNGHPNIENVVVKNCRVERPLSGFNANGSLGGDGPYSLNEPSFLDGTLNENLVDGVVFRNNTVIRARGNDYIFSTGVINSQIHDNQSYHSMYHSLRFYTSVLNCHAYNNHVYTDIDYLASGYNSTDLWYWRTDNTASGQYLARRSGFRAGSGYTSVVDCSMEHNTICYENSSPASSIIDNGPDFYGIQTNVSAVKNIAMRFNKVYRSPAGGIFGIALSGADDGKYTTGVVFSHNEIYECANRPVLFQGDNFSAFQNHFENCAASSSVPDVVKLKGNRIKFYKNSFAFTLNGASVNTTVFKIANQTADNEPQLFVSDNMLEGYIGDIYAVDDSSVETHGSNIGYKPSLENGWSNSAGDLTFYLSCSGTVSVLGAINGSSSTDSNIVTLPDAYRPENLYGNGVGIQTVDIGDGTSEGETFPMRVAGTLKCDTRGLSASRVAFCFTYQASRIGVLFN